jgi:hypothetical protein
MGRRDEEETIVMRSSSIEAVSISSFVNGGMTISNVWVEVGGVRQTQIPLKLTPGTAFVVHVAFQARNNAGGVITAWSVCLTVIDNQRQIYNYGYNGSWLELPGQINTNDLALNNLATMVMPDRDITLTIKGWGSDTLRPGDPPPLNLW